MVCIPWICGVYYIVCTVCCTCRCDKGKRNLIIDGRNPRCMNWYAPGITGSGMDCLKAKARREELQYMSYRDMLTTLYNRNKYIQVVDSAQGKTVRRTGVAYIDINGLNQTNDSYGHEAGDKLIVNTGQSIIDVLPENAYRVGRDEFVIICFDMEEEIARKKLLTICENIAEKNVKFPMGVIWRESLDFLENMLKEADDLIYVEKKKYYKNTDILKYFIK